MILNPGAVELRKMAHWKTWEYIKRLLKGKDEDGSVWRYARENRADLRLVYLNGNKIGFCYYPQIWLIER